MKIPPFNDRTLFYAASGKDIEPLLRFSNICDTFIFSNLYMSFEEVHGFLHRALEEHPLLEIEDEHVDHNFDESTHFELSPDYCRHLASVDGLPTPFLEDYKRTFTQAQAEPQWMITLRLRRRDLGRRIMLHYFTSESLATYILLSHNGRHVPKMLVTVETKVLEMDNDLVPALFRHLGSRPPLWLKGFQAQRDWDPSLGMDGDGVLRITEAYPHIGMDCIGSWLAEGEWMGAWGNDTMAVSGRICRVVATDEAVQQVQGHPFGSFGDHRIMQGDLFEIVAKEAHPGDWLVATGRLLARRATCGGTRFKSVKWEDILAGKPQRMTGKTMMDESLRALENALTDAARQGELPGQVFLLPLGMEDQGALLADFLKVFKLTHLCVVVRRPFDLVDLRFPATRNQKTDTIPPNQNRSQPAMSIQELSNNFLNRISAPARKSKRVRIFDGVPGLTNENWFKGAYSTTLGMGIKKGTIQKVNERALEAIRNRCAAYDLGRLNDDAAFDHWMSTEIDVIRGLVRNHSPETTWTIGRSQKIINILLKYCCAAFHSGRPEFEQFRTENTYFERLTPLLHAPVDRATVKHLIKTPGASSDWSPDGRPLSWWRDMNTDQYEAMQGHLKTLSGNEKIYRIQYEMKHIW